MIAIYLLGSFAMFGGFVAMSRDTLRGGAMLAESQRAGVLGHDLRVVAGNSAQTRPWTARERDEAAFVPAMDADRLATKSAAGTQRLKGAVGECPRGIPA